jgi:nitroreductase
VFDTKAWKWVKKTVKPKPVTTGGPSFENSGLPSIDMSGVTAVPEVAVTAGPSQAEIDAENARQAAAAAAEQARRQAQADQYAREGLSAYAAAILAGASGEELADITIQERSGNLDLANALQEAASGRRTAQISTRAEQNRAAYEGAIARQRAAAEMAAQGFGGAGIGSYQRMVMERQTGQELSDAEARLVSALSAFDRMKQQAQARRDAAQANLLARINPVAQFTRGGA